GHDFQAAYEHAMDLAAECRLHALRSFHPWLVVGVGTYALELFHAVADIDTVYVPIGLGSGICGTIAARDALGLTTKIVGVVAENAPAYALSFARKAPASTNNADTIADGMACRVPDEAALDIVFKGADRIVTVSEAEIKAAMRHYFTDTHNVAEGAGAAPLAALLQEGARMAGKRVALILSGGNIDRDVYVTGASALNPATFTLDGWGGNASFSYIDRANEDGCSFSFDNDWDSKGVDDIAHDLSVWSATGWFQPVAEGNRDWLFIATPVVTPIECAAPNQP
ncbi:MAG: pyridoxal-phosphate dependent enzyme, partial [Candidatus Latescibacteria bacterium]|nr:pyridoxal-phosphate dependent enzyme [Candidatus Latescibacterota bacterium]